MASIAFIGTEGSGKTVMISTLAKRFSNVEVGGCFLEPCGATTLKYVERVWNLLNSGEWPRSTGTGELFLLRWELRSASGLSAEIRIPECAGQDLRLLFAEEKIQNLSTLPPQLKDLAEYCRNSDIVLFLVNLEDFIGEGDAEKRLSNQVAIKEAMDYLSRPDRPRRFSVILTQADLYASVVNELGGWLEALKLYLPYVYSAHLHTSTVPIWPVSAVLDTATVIEDGKGRRVPGRDFRSEGLEPVLAWLAREAAAVSIWEHKAKIAHEQEAERNRVAAENQRIADEKQAIYRRRIEWFKAHAIQIACGVLVFIGVIVWWMTPRPIPILYTTGVHLEEHGDWGWYMVKVVGEIGNRGDKECRVYVVCTIRQGRGQEWSRSSSIFTIGPNQLQLFDVVFTEPQKSDGKPSFEVKEVIAP